MKICFLKNENNTHTGPSFFWKKKWNTLLSSQFLCGKSHKLNYNSREKSKSWNYFEIFENLNHTALVDSSIQKGRIKMVNGNTGATAGYLVPAFDFFDEKRLWEQFKEKKKGYSDRCHIDVILVVFFLPEITLLWLILKSCFFDQNTPLLCQKIINFWQNLIILNQFSQNLKSPFSRNWQFQLWAYFHQTF